MSQDAAPAIGFAGLGLMGGHMARNLAAAGHAVTVWNRSPEKVRDFVADNGGDDPAALAQAIGAGIVIICVADTPALEAVIEGDAGILAGLASGAVVVDMGTTRVDTTRRLADAVATRGASYVDAPVSGGEVGARDGTLSIMAGGADADLERVSQAFAATGSSCTHVGPVGAGQVAKAANQLIVGLGLAAVAEALLLAEKGGADAGKTRSAMLGGFAGSRILDLHGQRMLDEAFERRVGARTQLKDLEQTLDLAEQLGLTLPMLEAGTQMWREMVARGWGDLDQSGIAKVPRALSDEE